MDNILTVRELTEPDIELITNYWLTADDDYLLGMGAERSKIPARQDWVSMLSAQLRQSYTAKQSYATIWLIDGVPVGHCNVNKIMFGDEAYMHLHMWYADKRNKGMGLELVKKSLPFFFNKLQLKNLYSEPYSLNIGPNKTLEKAGFVFVKTFRTIPGMLNFEQDVNLWQMSSDTFKSLQKV